MALCYEERYNMSWMSARKDYLTLVCSFLVGSVLLDALYSEIFIL